MIEYEANTDTLFHRIHEPAFAKIRINDLHGWTEREAVTDEPSGCSQIVAREYGIGVYERKRMKMQCCTRLRIDKKNAGPFLTLLEFIDRREGLLLKFPS
jgi:hypothetical protein